MHWLTRYSHTFCSTRARGKTYTWTQDLWYSLERIYYYRSSNTFEPNCMATSLWLSQYFSNLWRQGIYCLNGTIRLFFTYTTVILIVKVLNYSPINLSSIMLKIVAHRKIIIKSLNIKKPICTYFPYFLQKSMTEKRSV